MDDEGNDLEDLFEEYEERDGAENADKNGNEANPSKPTENAEKVAAPRRAVKNPRLKFNAERLCGERGIPTIVKHFEGVKFKGKGHEVEDLNKLMATLEHWCHRLYPQMKFDDCLRQIEKLGKKRPVQTCLRKIRLDMPLLNDDFIHDERDEDENQVEEEIPPQDAFDRLIDEYQGNSTTHLVSTPLPVKTSASEQRVGTFGSTLTEEQRKRMEYNKMLATERRKAKFLAMESCSAVPSTESEDLFDKEIASTSNNHPTNALFDDILPKSKSQLSHQTDPSQSVSVRKDSSDELELDDLVDLVDEPGCIDDSSIVSTGSNLKAHCQSNYVNLSDEDESETFINNKQTTEIVDLEHEGMKKTNSNKNQIEFVDLEKPCSHNGQVEVVDLDFEKPSTSVQVVSLEDEEIIELGEGTTNSNAVADFISTPSILSRDLINEAADVSVINKMSVLESENIPEIETGNYEVQLMEVD